MSAGSSRAEADYARALNHESAMQAALKVAQEALDDAKGQSSEASLDLWRARMIQHPCQLCDVGSDEPCIGLEGRQVHTVRGIEPERRTAAPTTPPAASEDTDERDLA